MIYGRNPVKEAIESGQALSKILVQKNIEGSAKEIIFKAKEQRIRVDRVEKKSLDREMEKAGHVGVNHQGIIGFIEDYKYTDFDKFLGKLFGKGEANKSLKAGAQKIAQNEAHSSTKGGAPFVMLLDGIEDPHNLGAIIRTAEAAGVDGVIIPERRASGVTETVVKASAGAVFHIPVVKVTNIGKAIDRLKEKNTWIYGLDMNGENYSDVNYDGAVALVVGSEGKGLSRLVREKCDFIVSIPMSGKVGSLNASNAAAIMIYEVRKNRDDS